MKLEEFNPLKHIWDEIDPTNNIKWVDVTRRCVTCGEQIRRGSGKSKYCKNACYPKYPLPKSERYNGYLRNDK